MFFSSYLQQSTIVIDRGDVDHGERIGSPTPVLDEEHHREVSVRLHNADHTLNIE